MKLILITAVKEFEKDIKSILKNAEIENFSFQDITGYKTSKKDADMENWFPGERHENKSIIFYAFVKRENTDGLFNRIKTFNEKCESETKIHISVLNVEKSN